MRKGRYFLSRINKTNLDQQNITEALLDSPIIPVGKYNWTITDAIDAREESIPFIFGNLVKYASEGQVKIVKEKSKLQINTVAPNLIEASAPFIYLPEFSGIAYMPVWNGIQEQVFRNRLASLIKFFHEGLVLINCTIEPITDYKAFISKLKSIEKFTEISATVQPPNPMFGRLWKNLNKYVDKRNASDVSVKETSKSSQGLNTQVVQLVVNISKNSEYIPEQEVDITDEAILMAADGYGKGKVIGISSGEEVIIKTSDNQVSFLFDKEPLPKELSIVVDNKLEKIVKERDMKH